MTTTTTRGNFEYGCAVCGDKFPTMNGARIHVRNMHGIGEDGQTIPGWTGPEELKDTFEKALKEARDNGYKAALADVQDEVGQWWTETQDTEGDAYASGDYQRADALKEIVAAYGRAMNLCDQLLDADPHENATRRWFG